MGTRFRGLLGILAGILIAVISIAGFWVAVSFITGRIGEIPVVGPRLLDMLQIFNLPGARYFFPLLGLFLSILGVALAVKAGWARLGCIVTYALSAIYLLAILIILVPLNLPLISSYRWYILAGGLVLVLALFWEAKALLSQKAEREFAAQYIGQRVVDKCDRCGTRLDQRGKCPKCEPKPRAQADRKPPPSRPRPKPQPPRLPLAQLVGDDEQVYSIRDERTAIGREEEENDIVLTDESISREHAEIIYQRGQFAVRDLDSTNGTFVNGRKTQQSRLEDGCEVAFGRVKFIFKVTPDTA